MNKKTLPTRDFIEVISSKNGYELRTVGSGETGVAARILSRDGRMTMLTSLKLPGLLSL